LTDRSFHGLQGIYLYIPKNICAILYMHLSFWSVSPPTCYSLYKNNTIACIMMNVEINTKCTSFLCAQTFATIAGHTSLEHAGLLMLPRPRVQSVRLCSHSVMTHIHSIDKCIDTVK
jgi:hypothetical protein